jgi:hypothetical protein
VSRWIGVVRDSTTTPAAITAKARTAAAMPIGLCVKCSSKSQTVRTMLAQVLGSTSISFQGQDYFVGGTSSGSMTNLAVGT